MSDGPISRLSAIEALNTLRSSDIFHGSLWEDIGLAIEVIDGLEPTILADHELCEREIAGLRAELSALRAAQPLTPCPTGHCNVWLDGENTTYELWSESFDYKFCPDCGALLDSLADGETK